MPEHRALVVTIPSAARPGTSGATLRVDDVVAVLAESGHAADVAVQVPETGRWCTAVAVSYASSGSLRSLSHRAPRTWLDAMDSWLLVNGSGLRRGHLSYAARAARDAARLATAPRAGLVTWISAADQEADRGTVRGEVALVLPGAVGRPPVRQATSRRAVAVGDWSYMPNRDGLAWLAREVLPRCEVVVDVYGKGAQDLGPALRRHGYVQDAEEAYASGDVHLGPVRFGGGVKRKVLQPLLAGLPVVTTAAGAHGLRAHPLLDVHDDPAAFAAALRARLAVPLEPPRPADPAALFDRNDRDGVLSWLRDCRGC